MSKQPKPAIVILKKKGENTRHMFFYDHNDAMDTITHFVSLGWKWQMAAPEVYPVGETPQIQRRLL